MQVLVLNVKYYSDTAPSPSKEICSALVDIGQSGVDIGQFGVDISQFGLYWLVWLIFVSLMSSQHPFSYSLIKMTKSKLWTTDPIVHGQQTLLYILFKFKGVKVHEICFQYCG